MWPVFPQRVPYRRVGQLNGVGILFVPVTPAIQYDEYMRFAGARVIGCGPRGRLLISQYLVHLYNIYLKDRNIFCETFFAKHFLRNIFCEIFLYNLHEMRLFAL